MITIFRCWLPDTNVLEELAVLAEKVVSFQLQASQPVTDSHEQQPFRLSCLPPRSESFSQLSALSDYKVGLVSCHAPHDMCELHSLKP